jgi:hypothetical protein
MENYCPPLLRGPGNYARCALNEACSKSPCLIIEFLAGMYCVQRFYLSNMLHILHLRSFVSAMWFNCQYGLVLLTDYNDYPA